MNFRKGLYETLKTFQSIFIFNYVYSYGSGIKKFRLRFLESSHDCEPESDYFINTFDIHIIRT